MAYQLINGRFQAFTDAGAFAVGYKLYTYDSGTTTPKATYTDATLSSVNTNPVVLDARGEAQVWLGSGAYTFVLKDASGVTVWTVDGVVDSSEVVKDYILDRLMSSDPGDGVDMVFGAGKVVSSIAELRALPKTGNGSAFVLGYYTAGDGGGGPYYYDPSDTSSADNGGTVIVASDGGRWKLSHGGTVSIEQFGCIPSQSAASNTTTLQNAINWAVPLGFKLVCGPGTFNFSAGITKTQSFFGINLEGPGEALCIFNYSSISPGSAFWTIVGGSGAQAHARITGIQFVGNSNSICADIQGMNGQDFWRCRFGANAIALKFNNAAAGQFTEYCCAIDCEFDYSCPTAISYVVGAGNSSFHGSGMMGKCCVHNDGTSPAVVIGAGAQPYNVPMSFQAWTSASCTLISNYASNTLPCTFHGDITIEVGGGTATLQTGPTVFIAGNVLSNNQNWALGTAALVNDVTINSDGSQRYSLKPYSVQTSKNISSGGVVAFAQNYYEKFSSGISTALLLTITLIGNNYRYTHLAVFVPANGAGGSDSISMIANPIAFNTAGWGASTFSISGLGKLIVTNASPGFSVQVSIGVTQLGNAIWS